MTLSPQINADERQEKFRDELFELAIDDFRLNLEKLRKLYPVKTICMHGSPLSKWDNRDLWKRYDYRDYGIIGEPYFDVDFDEVLYLTDTGRRWDGDSVSVRDKVLKKKDKNAGIKANAGIKINKYWNAGILGCWDAGMLAPVEYASLSFGIQRGENAGMESTDDRGRRSEVRSRRSEVGGRRTEDEGRRKREDGRKDDKKD